jgi:bifunctional DNase/RNase
MLRPIFLRITLRLTWIEGMQLDRPDSHEMIIQNSSECVERTKELITQSRATDVFSATMFPKTLELLSKARQPSEGADVNSASPFPKGFWSI